MYILNDAHLIYTSTEDGVPLLIPLQCKYGPFVLPQSARQITCEGTDQCSSEKNCL